MERGQRSIGSHIKRFFATIFLSIIVVFAAAYAFLYFVYGVNSIRLPFALNDINKSYSVDSTATADDYTAFKDKKNTISNKVTFTSDEICAYLMNNESFDDVDFVNISFDEDKVTTTVRYDAKDIKKKSAFVGDKLPDYIYLEAVSEVVIEDSTSYSTKPISLKFHNLSMLYSKEIINTLSIFNDSWTKKDFINEINNKTLDFLVGDTSLFSELKIKGATGYGIEGEDFAVYYVGLDEERSITFTNTMDTENPNPTSYTIASGIINLIELSKPGYEFLGWYIGDMRCESIDSALMTDITLEAKWKIRDYSIEYKNTKDSFNPNPTSYNMNSSLITLEDLSKPGYVFLGWYMGDTKYTTIEPTLFLDLELEAKWDIITYQISYLQTRDAENPNPTSYTVEDSNITLLPISANAYEFNGWYYGSLKQTTIDTSSLTDIVLSAKWSLKKYEITYVLNGATNPSTNPKYYTIEDEITLTNPTRAYATFVGWSDGVTPTTDEYKIIKGSTGLLTLTAIFEGDVNTINLVCDSVSIASFEIDKGLTLTEEYLNSHLELESGYYVDKWYLDSDMTMEYAWDKSITIDTSLYGSLSYIVNDISFYPYINAFDIAVNTGSINITSHSMLRAYAEYVMYNNITKKVTLNLKYSNSSPSDEINAVCNEIRDADFFTTNVSYHRSGTSGSCYIYAVASWDSYASEIYDETKSSILAQQDYALEKSTSGRGSSYDSFNRYKATKSLKCSTSNQLVFALENGYIPEPTGRALEVYNKALDILRSIITDDMDDIEKLSRIYEYLILNVSYDHKAAEAVDNHLIDVEDALVYRSWYAEGALLDGIGVCEAYAKAFVILANIENIPCIYVAGNGHAWNRVYVDGDWYVVDATHGDLAVNNKYEVLTYRQFMITDEFKASLGYTSDDYKSFKATKVYNYYKEYKYSHMSIVFDLYFTSESTVSPLAGIINTHSSYTSAYRTVEVVLENGMKVNDIAKKLSSYGIVVESSISIKDVEGNNLYILLLN